MDRKIRLLSLLLLVLVVLSMVSSAFTEEQGQYFIEDEVIRLELAGFPEENREEFVDFTLIRAKESSEALEFSLEDLVDEEGRLFPRELVAIRTAYDSRLQKTSLAYNQIRFLASGDEYAEVSIGVLYNEAIPAGTYRGALYSLQGQDIPIEIVVNRYTSVTVEPKEISLHIPGPGQYKAEEPIEVTVWANHGDWAINLSCSGLFYQEEEQNRVGMFEEKPVRTPLQLSVVGEEIIALDETPLILGTGNSWGTTLNFEVQTEAGWKHRAGDYAGVIKIDVSIQD